MHIGPPSLFSWLPVALLVAGLSSCSGRTGGASLAAPPTVPSQAPDGFWEHWGDGEAELAGYRLTQPRYGEPRTGEAVLITVTEDFLPGPLVKAEREQADRFPIVKLNEVRDFSTGLYDYNVMTSAFVPLDGRLARGLPVKISFTSQEWCGHVYDAVTWRDDQVQHVWHSYFDGEADGETTQTSPEGALAVDAMPLLVRDLAGPLIASGDTRDVSVWVRAIDRRFTHNEPGFVDATLQREAATRQVEVPAGTFQARRTTLQIGDRVGSWDVEVAPPHRLVRWAWSDGEVGELTGVMRSPYWSKNALGDEQLRADLKLAQAQPDGMRVVEASGDVPATVDRLRTEIEGRDLTILATIDHGAGAQGVDLELRPTVLLLFGNPKAGTLVMQQGQSAGLDLPLRVLVFQDEAGTTRMSYVDPAWIAARHGASSAPVVDKMAEVIQQIVEAAR